MLLSKLKTTGVVGLLVGIFCLAGSAIALRQLPQGGPLPDPGQQPAKKKDAKPRTDHYGDPLPVGALARLGTVRWRAGPVSSLFFSPDGKTLISHASDSTVRRWEVATGKEMHKFQGPDRFVGNAKAISRDGKFLAIAAETREINLWDVTAGKKIRQFRGHKGDIIGITFSADGKLLASVSSNHAGSDHSVIIWDVVTAKEHFRFHPAGQVRGLVFSPDGSKIVSGIDGGLVHIRTIGTFKGELQLRGHAENGAGVSTLAILPDGRILAAGGDHRQTTIFLWEMETGKVLHRIEGHSGSITALAFSPDGKTLISGAVPGATGTSRKQLVALWDVTTGKEIRRLGGTAHVQGPFAFSPDGKVLAAGSYSSIQLWDLATGDLLNRSAAHKEGVCRIAFSPDGKTVATSSYDGGVRTWETGTGKHLRMLADRPWGVPHVAFASQGKHLVFAELDCRIAEVETGKEVRKLEFGENERPEHISADGQTLVTESGRGLVRVWEITAGKEIAQLKVEPSATVLALSSDGKTLLFQPRDESDPAIRVWDVASKKVVRTLSFPDDFQGIGGPDVRSAVFSPDGKDVAFVVQGSRVALWNIATGKEFRRFAETTDEIFCVAFSPDGKRLAAGNWDTTTRVFDVATGKELCRLVGHESHIHSVCFSPDGRTLATGSGDSTALLWDLSQFLPGH